MTAESLTKYKRAVRHYFFINAPSICRCTWTFCQPDSSYSSQQNKGPVLSRQVTGAASVCFFFLLIHHLWFYLFTLLFCQRIKLVETAESCLIQPPSWFNSLTLRLHLVSFAFSPPFPACGSQMVGGGMFQRIRFCIPKQVT